MFDLSGGDTHHDTPVEVKIGYVGGGSEGWAHTLMNDLGQTEDITGEVALYDVDYEAAQRNAELGNQVQALEEATSDWTYRAYEERADALRDADFVVISTQDPPEETFKHDLDIPKEYGLYQTVGDTCGPGGAVRALRSIPQYREIAATIREECPDAWVINYTNPMTVCTRTLYEEFPDINAIGLCHEVTHVQERLAEKIAEFYDLDDEDAPTGDDVYVNVKGVNHFTFIDEVTWEGQDAWEVVEAELEERQPLPRFEPGDLEDRSYWTNLGDVRYHFLERFGILGAAGDRHMVEFVPWYLDDVETEADIERWGTRCTPSSARVSDDDGPSRTEQYLAGEKEFEFGDSGEEAVKIMRALLGFEPLQTHGNMPNRGQCPDLPEGAVVETNVIMTDDTMRPVTAGEHPLPVRNLVTKVVNTQEALVEAGFAEDLDLGFQAFLNEPLVTLDPEEARELFVDLVEAERAYFQDYDLDSAAVMAGEVPVAADD